MREPVHLIVAFVFGLGLGTLYFGGLWLTVRRLPTARWPVFLTLGSLFARLATVMAGFYLVMAGQWERLVACVAGFTLTRFAVVARTRPPDTSDLVRAKEQP